MKKSVYTTCLNVNIGLFVFICFHILCAAEPYQGYTFVASGSKAYLYDMKKQKVHEWKASGGSVQTAAYLLPDGSALFPLNKGGCSFKPGGAHPHGTFERVSWEGKIVWKFKFCEKDFTPSYDLEPMPNGNILVIAGYQSANKPGKVFEIKPKGSNDAEVVWEFNSNATISGVSGYTNSVSYNPDLDQIMLNIQTPGRTLAIIDHASPGKLLFKFNKGFSDRIHGGCWVTDKYLGTDITIPEADKETMRVGNILTVSNGNKEVVEVDPKTQQKVKSIKYSFSAHQGSVQRLPNGNTLVTSGSSKKVDEIDDSGKKVWTLTTQVSIRRAYKYGLKYPGVSKLNPTGLINSFAHGKNEKIRMVQNRTLHQVSLYFKDSMKPTPVRIFSLNGQEVFSGVAMQSPFVLTTKHFSPGLYIVNINQSTGLYKTIMNCIL